MNKHITSALVAMGIPALLCAQAPLAPVWSQQWAFGQDETEVPYGVSPDNRVAVDPVTGNVYVTIDDQLEQYSPHFDLLQIFAQNGLDLTPQPIPLLGSAAAGVNDPANVESTSDLAVRNGVVYHARELNLGFGSGTVGSLCAHTATGDGWKLGMGRIQGPMKGRVLADALGVLALRSLGSSTNLHAVDPDGWPQWTRSAPGHDAVLMGSEVVTMHNGTLNRFDRTTGDPIVPGVLVYAGSYAPVIATDGTRIFYAYTDWTTGNCTWGCASLDGSVLWSHTAALDLNLMEIEVDGFGRPWLIGNSTVEGAPPLLIVTGSNGGSYDTFTHGTSMNDIAMGDGQAYITGRLDNTTSTYLIAVGTDLTTAVEPPVQDRTVRLYPQPASTSLNIANATVVRGTRVLDITGKAVAAAVLSSSALDVSKLSEGVYFVELRSADGPVTKRFVVVR